MMVASRKFMLADSSTERPVRPQRVTLAEAGFSGTSRCCGVARAVVLRTGTTHGLSALPGALGPFDTDART